MRFHRVYIEVSNICNLQCNFCPEVERANQVLSKENFESILRQVKFHTHEVCLHVMGEPLAHPEFSELIGLCRRHDLKVQITTNATLLKPQSIEALMLPNVRQINISLQSFAANLKSTLQSSEYNAKLNKYLAKIFELVDQVKILRPDLYVQFRMWNQGAVESKVEERVNREMLEKLEEKFGTKIDFSKIDLKFKKTAPLGARFSVQFDSRFRWPNLHDDILSTTGFCHALSGHVAIHADGKVVPCCLDKEAKITLGNIFETPFVDILNQERTQNMKNGFARGELCESLCQRCDFVQRFSLKAKRIRLKEVPA